MKTSFSSPRSRGFTLVEVALALGIASFALVSILGLLNVAVDTDGGASRDTTFAAMSNHVMNDLRSMPFDSLWTAEPEKNRSVAAANGPAADTVFYFTNEGTPVDASDATSADKSKQLSVLYRCTVKKTADVRTQSVGSAAYNQLQLQLIFAWPVTGAGTVPTNASTQTVYGSISRY